jgi:hypothetical protein
MLGGHCWIRRCSVRSPPGRSVQELITRLDIGDYRFDDGAFSERVKNRGPDT